MAPCGSAGRRTADRSTGRRQSSTYQSRPRRLTRRRNRRRAGFDNCCLTRFIRRRYPLPQDMRRRTCRLPRRQPLLRSRSGWLGPRPTRRADPRTSRARLARHATGRRIHPAGRNTSGLQWHRRQPTRRLRHRRSPSRHSAHSRDRSPRPLHHLPRIWQPRPSRPGRAVPARLVFHGYGAGSRRGVSLDRPRGRHERLG